MMSRAALLLLALLPHLMALPQQLSLSSTSPFDPTTSTSQQYGENFYSFDTRTSPDYDANLNIFLPSLQAMDARNGSAFPLVLFFPGFVGNFPTITTKDLLFQISSKGEGAVVVAWDGIGVANPADLPGILRRTEAIHAWATTGPLQDFLTLKTNSSRLQVSPDPRNLIFASHSGGAQISSSMAKLFPNAGLILLDPVDEDPVHFTTPVITDGVPQNYSGPVLVLASGLGEVSPLPLLHFPACVTPGFGSQHFYDAYTTGPKYLLNGTVYGHTDIMDDAIAFSVSTIKFCASVKDTNLHPYHSFRDFAGGAAASFIAMYTLPPSYSGTCKKYKEFLQEGDGEFSSLGGGVFTIQQERTESTCGN